MAHDPNETQHGVEKLAVEMAASIVDLTVTNGPKGGPTMSEVKELTQPKANAFPFMFTDPDTGIKVQACSKGQAWGVIGCGSKEQLNMMVDAGRIRHLGYRPRMEGSAQPEAVYEWTSVLEAKASYHPRGTDFGHRYMFRMEPKRLGKALERYFQVLSSLEDEDDIADFKELYEAVQTADDLTLKGSEKRARRE